MLPYRRRVFLHTWYPSGLTATEHDALLARMPEARHWKWEMRVREARVYVRGTVRHPDHRTITLHDWHRVVMNTESEAPGREHLVFLD